MTHPQQPCLFETDPAPWDLDAARDQRLARVVFAEGPPGEFDYHVPDVLRARLQLGARVWVPFGRGNAQRVGYCVEVCEPDGRGRRLKPLRRVLDEPSLISPEVLDLARWIADYYLSDLGVVLECVVPAGVRSRAGTREHLFYSRRDGSTESGRLSRQQRAVLDYLGELQRPATAREIAAAVGCTSAPVKSLVRRKLLREERRRVFTQEAVQVPVPRAAAPRLTDDQHRALDAIRQLLQRGDHETILLFGVTGSGKTEVYIRAIQEVVQCGRQAIVLVPEISLTPQTRRRFEARLPRVAVLHSHMTDVERHEQWRRVACDQVDVVVGARSAIFAPVHRLGLIVIDEEHETSFKQDIQPRYHARDVAARRAQQAGIPLVLGSATPSLESWYRVERGVGRVIQLPERANQLPLPDVSIVDLRREFRDRALRGSLSRPLVLAMRESLSAGGQVILLLNRRGFSSHIQCPHCGAVVRCEHCDVALTHHRERDVALCHYCEYERPTPPACPQCQFPGIRFGGTGTERLEAEVRAAFADYPSLRMDTDTMRRAGSHEAALDRFRSGEVRILLGTQMIAKGLDFPNVTLVGVVNADMALHLQDFRALERTFQLVTQVAGRTGRGPRGGRVIVQTFSPDLNVIRAAARHDYLGFVHRELPRREALHYPPVTSLVRLVVRGPRSPVVREFAQTVADTIRQVAVRLGMELRLLGPAVPQVPRLRGRYRMHLFALSTQTNLLHAALRESRQRVKPPADIQWMVDVDPLQLM